MSANKFVTFIKCDSFHDSNLMKLIYPNLWRMFLKARYFTNEDKIYSLIKQSSISELSSGLRLERHHRGRDVCEEGKNFFWHVILKLLDKLQKIPTVFRPKPNREFCPRDLLNFCKQKLKKIKNYVKESTTFFLNTKNFSIFLDNICHSETKLCFHFY